jgi:type II secretion system protein D
VNTLLTYLLMLCMLGAAFAQNAPPPAGANPTAAPPGAPAPSGANPTAAPPGARSAAPLTADVPSPTDELQLSFQGANIDMVVQWLAKTTGKSVIKHKSVQCQLTIVSSKKLLARDALNLVYRALALEGFTAIETSKSVLILPEGQDPKMAAEVVDNGNAALPEGRQRLVKIFQLQNATPAEIREKVRPVLSEKATVEVAERAQQLIITDFTDNIRLAGELIRELDVPSGGDVVIEFFTLKYSEAEELGSLLTLVLNAQPAPPSSPSSSSSSRSSSSSSRSSPPGIVMSEGSPTPSPPPSSSSSSSSSGSSGGAAAQQVRIWPDKISNRLIVAAQKSKMPEVKRLIDLLDSEKPRDVAIRVIQLKHVSAEDLVRDLGPLYQKLSGKSVKDMIEVSYNSRANSLIVLSGESNFKLIESLVESLDTAEAQEKVIRTFLLKNADAEEVAKQLQDLNQDTSSQSRYPFYVFSSYSSGRSGPSKPTFVADKRRNTVIVQAPPANMENIASMIEALDEPVADDSLAPKIYRLKYVSAVDIEEILNELFLKRQTQRSYWDPYGFPMRDQESGDRSAGRLYGKVRITSEPYANAIIVTSNSKENLAAVEDILSELDVPSSAGESTLRVGLRFAKAATLANSINILFAKNGSPPMRGQPQQNPQQGDARQQQQQQGSATVGNFALEQENREEGYFPWLGGQPDNNARGPDGRSTSRPVSDLVGRVRVVPDHRSNALLISANVHFFPQVLKLIHELDAPTAQVLIEAKIVEVSTDFTEKLGVRWSPDGGAVFTADDLDNSFIVQSRGRYAEDFGGKSGLLSASLNSMRSGFIDNTISLDFLIQFLRRTTDASVLAEPQINVADNEMGKLFVGQQVPFIERSQSTDVGALNQSFSYKDVGVILEVTPHINTAGDVALKIRAESSSIVPGQTLFGGAILDTRNFRTDLTAKDGQTLVLGGIIQKQVSDTLRKTPILGSIPGLGWAFKKKDKIRREVELLVFLRPKVVRTPEQAQQLMEEVDRKAPLIKDWRERMQPAPAKEPGPTPE